MKIEAKIRLQASEEPRTAEQDTAYTTLRGEIAKQAAKMEEHQISKGSPDDYAAMQRQMQQLLHKLKPLSRSSDQFDYTEWKHSGKPFRKSNALRAALAKGAKVSFSEPFGKNAGKTLSGEVVRYAPAKGSESAYYVVSVPGYPESFEVNPKYIKASVAAQLTAAEENPLEEGVAFDTLVDGDPSTDEPVVQEVTHDDGGIEKADPDQDLLMDDIAN